jgi:hypothetical protein
MAAQNGNILLRGRSGKTYSPDVYVPDTVATLGRFNTNGAAGAASTDYYKTEEDCVIEDFSLATAPTATGGVFLLSGAPIPAATIRYANQLTSVQNRTKLKIFVKKGEQLGLLQF